jgi:hypothetical protein
MAISAVNVLMCLLSLFCASVPYNPVTLQYNDSLDGLRMQYSDNMTKVFRI